MRKLKKKLRNLAQFTWLVRTEPKLEPAQSSLSFQSMSNIERGFDDYNKLPHSCAPVTGQGLWRNVILYVFHSKVLIDKDTTVERTEALPKVTKVELWECNLSFHSCFYYIIKSLWIQELGIH